MQVRCYAVECICSINNSLYTRQDEVIISEWPYSNSISLPGWTPPDHWEWMHLERPTYTLFVSEDSLFVPFQWSLIYCNGISISVIGKGKIENDSIFFDFVEGLYPRDFSKVRLDTYTCKGKKSASGIVSPPESVQNKVYYDSNRQVIVFDEILQNQSFTFELVDMQGRVILRKTNADNPINIANLSNGVYLYRVMQNSQLICSGKIVKK